MCRMIPTLLMAVTCGSHIFSKPRNRSSAGYNGRIASVKHALDAHFQYAHFKPLHVFSRLVFPSLFAFYCSSTLMFHIDVMTQFFTYTRAPLARRFPRASSWDSPSPGVSYFICFSVYSIKLGIPPRQCLLSSSRIPRLFLGRIFCVSSFDSRLP